MKVKLRKRPSLHQIMEKVSLLVEVAGLKEKRVDVKRHTAEVLLSTRTTLDETLSSKESQ